MTISRRVVVTQPYLAAYRIPLWNLVQKKLAEVSLDLVIMAGTPKGSQAARGDMKLAPYVQTLPSFQVRALGRDLIIRPYPRLRRSDILVTEMSASNLTAWRALLVRPSRTVLWGHARSYVNDPTWIGRKVKSLLVRRAAYNMTYTAAGKDYAIAVLGSRESRVIAIGNSTDTAALESARNAVSATRIRELKTAWNLKGRTAMFVGGLDKSKRIDFLAECADEAIKIDQNFRLLVAGQGQDLPLLYKGVRANYIHYVGPADTQLLAELGAVADQIWMPGRIGLIAIDALTLGIPVHTLASKHHAPEVDYLSEGSSMFTHPTDPELFAREALDTEKNDDRVQQSIEPLNAPSRPSLETMAASFVSTVQRIASQTP